MDVLILGGVAAGTKAAAKIKRQDPDANVTILVKDKDISYAGCGLPYYLSGQIESRDALIVNTPQKYTALTGAQVLTGKEAVALDAKSKTVTAHDLATGQTEQYAYDALIIATGASSVMPPIPGIQHKGVFCLRTPEDAISMRAYLEREKAQHAVVIGGGFIGLEAAENLLARGLSVTVLDVAGQIMPGVLDKEMADFACRKLTEAGMRVLTGTAAQAILGEGRVTAVQTAQETLPADVVVVSAGIRPNTAFLQDSGLEMFKGCILVDDQLRTSLPDVYAAGDCAMVTNRLTGKRQWSSMGSSANMEARTLALALTEENKRYPGVLGTGVVKLPGINCGRTGLTETAAREEGYDVETIVMVTDDKAHYYPGAAWFVTKLIADKTTRKLLGVQVIGPGAVDKMVDIAVTGIAMGAALEDFDNLDLAYAPPFSTAIHPFVQAVYMLENKLDGKVVSMTPAQYAAGAAEGYRVVDVTSAGIIPGATFVQLETVNGPVEGLGKDEKLLLVCNRAKRAYFLQNRLRHYGYTNTVVLEGASFFNQVQAGPAENAKA